MIKLKTRLKRTLINVTEHASFHLKADRKALLLDFKGCASNDDLFKFAAEYIGIGQNKDEFMKFISYVEKRSPQTICEIGVRGGGTNFMLTNALKSCCTVVGVDILLQHIHLLRYFCRTGVSQFFISGDSSALPTLQMVERCLGKDVKLDVLFIDGDHSYEGVVRDFYAYRRLVKVGGVIAFHDICMDHRRRYGLETPNDSGEVYLFWKKIKTNYEYAEFYASEEQNGSGIGTIIWDPKVRMGNYLVK